MSEISEKGSSLLNRVEAKVRTTAFVKTNKAHKDEREAIDALDDYIASLESQLADVTAKRDALMDCFFEFETIAPNGELMASVLDMHKRLESLESQLAEAKARLAWIPVSERLPKFDKSVLFFIPDAETVTQGYRWRTPLGWRWSTEEDALFEQSKVTHWMPLPEAPKEDE